MVTIEVYDVGEGHYDHWTVILTEGDYQEVYTMSDDAASPQGVNAYCGDTAARKGTPAALFAVPSSVRRAIADRIADWTWSHTRERVQDD
jgi:hypothetical protein